ncbi:MAG: hypothetical protein ABJ375_21910 [Rhizobiaceae bacterium]
MTSDVRPGIGHGIGRPVQLATVDLKHVPEAIEDFQGCRHVVPLRRRGKSLGIVEQHFLATGLDQQWRQARQVTVDR